MKWPLLLPNLLPKPLTSRPEQLVNGIGRLVAASFRQLSDEAPLRLGQFPEGAAAMLGRQDRSTTPLHIVSHAVSTSPAGPLPTPETVKAGLTSKRPRRQVENDEYAAWVQRILRAYSRRVGDGDVEALALMLGLAEDIDAAIAVAVKGLRERGYSWAEIGSRLGITRQAAQQRWG